MVDILMATYNGEAFVEEQIRSIMRQSYTDWHLLIHDDGSTDSTVRIIQALVQEDNRIRLIDDACTHIGVARNFLHLLSYSTAPYCMWCDQDDIWLESKVETMVHAIESQDNTQPQVVYSNAYLWSAERGILSDKNTLTYPTTLQQALFLNTGIQGAAAIFNGAMRQLLCVPLAHYAMHDHVLLLSGITMGEVHYLHVPLMYYRQHSHNVTGNAPGSMRKKVALLWHNRHVPLVSRDHYEGVRAFYEQFAARLRPADRELMEVFLSLPDKGFLCRARLVCKYHFQLFDSTILLLMKMSIRKFI